MVWKKTSLIYSKKTWNTCKYPMVKWLYSVCVNITLISDKNSISKFTHKVNILIVIMKLTGTIYTQSSLKLILFQTTKWCTTSLQPLQGITGKCTVWYILMFFISFDVILQADLVILLSTPFSFRVMVGMRRCQRPSPDWQRRWRRRPPPLTPSSCWWRLSSWWRRTQSNFLFLISKSFLYFLLMSKILYTFYFTLIHEKTFADS